MTNFTLLTRHFRLAASVLAAGLGLLFLPGLALNAAEVEQKDPYVYEDDVIKFRVIRRSPKQIAAFYEGRGFPRRAIEKLTPTCYLAVIIKNKTNDTLWLELDNWRFENPQGSIQRLRRDYWKNVWLDIGLSQAHRSTFGWTLMPEVRDLRVDEGVGGNIPLPTQTQPIRIIARFNTGADKTGQVKTVVMDKVKCLKDSDVQ